MSRILSMSFAILLACGAQAADWPQWRGPTRDCRVEAPQAWPDSLDETSLTQQWRIPLGPGYSGPVVIGERVFSTETRSESHEVVRAFDRNTGEELWQVQWPGAMKVPFFARDNGSWIRSTPASDGENLYVAGIRDVLVSLNAATGEQNWRLDLVESLNSSLPGFGTVCSPLIDGDAIYLQAAASVVRINKTSGSIVWRSQPESGGLFGSSMGASAFSSPVIATIAGQRQLVVQSRNTLSGYDLDTGRQLWSTPVEAFRRMNILTPMVIGDTILTSTYGGGTFLYEVSRSDSGFQVQERWKTKKQGYMSSPVVIDGNVFLHLRNQRFSCIDPTSGDTTWTTRPFGKYWSMVTSGRRVLALDQRGVLHLIDASPQEYRELSTRQVSESETWAHLALADRQLFIRELDGLSVWNWR